MRNVDQNRPTPHRSWRWSTPSTRPRRLDDHERRDPPLLEQPERRGGELVGDDAHATRVHHLRRGPCPAGRLALHQAPQIAVGDHAEQALLARPEPWSRRGPCGSSRRSRPSSRVSGRPWAPRRRCASGRATLRNRLPSLPPGWRRAKSSSRKPLRTDTAIASASPRARLAVVDAVGARLSGQASRRTPRSRWTSAASASGECRVRGHRDQRDRRAA